MRLEWLGVNGFRLSDGSRTLLIDPYVTRDRERLSDPGTVRRLIPVADMVAVGHSHWDHLADVPVLARQTGCRVVGSPTTCHICASLGVKSGQLSRALPGERVSGDGWAVTLIPSRHIANGPDGAVLYAGTYQDAPDPPPCTAPEFLEGGTFALLLEFAGLTLLNIGSANLPAEGLPTLRPDILLLGIAGRAPSFIDEVLSAVTPKVVVPSHYDALTGPIGTGVSRDGHVKQAVADVRRCAPDATVLTPDPLEEIHLGSRC